MSERTPIPGRPDLSAYTVDRAGVVIGPKGRSLTASPNRPQAVAWATLPDGTTRPIYVAAAVLEAFVAPRPGGCVPGFADGDPHNCRVGNLYWRPRVGKGRRRKSSLPGRDTLHGRIRSTIRDKRLASGLSVEECGRRAGFLRPVAWAKVESACRRLTLDALLRACVALDCEPGDVIPGDWRRLLTRSKRRT